jgi:hypothetical protein
VDQEETPVEAPEVEQVVSEQPEELAEDAKVMSERAAAEPMTEGLEEPAGEALGEEQAEHPESAENIPAELVA